MAYKPEPKHTVIVYYDVKSNLYKVDCSLCGQLDKVHSWEKANDLRAAHMKPTP